MNSSDIASLLIERALTMDIDGMLIIDPFNADKTPVEGVEHMELLYLPNETVPMFLGNSSPNWYQGFLQVTVVWPKNLGEIAPREVADQVIEFWKRGTVLDGTGFRLKIDRPPWAAPAINSPPWVRVPVSIPYQVIA